MRFFPFIVDNAGHLAILIFAMSNPNKEMTLTEKNTEVSMLLDCYCESIVLGCNDADKYKAEAEAFNPTLAKFWFTKTRIKERMKEARQRVKEEGL